jgi:hypothetical protein
MSDLNLYIKLSMLPESLKTEISDYMDYLMSQKMKNKINQKRSPKAGFLKGTFVMSQDFDEPLEDFREYME